MKKQVYQYTISDVPGNQNFYARNGSVIKNLLEMVESLKTMKMKTFKFHVNRDKNDFSEWIRNSLKDKQLADKLARVIMKDKIEILILRKIIEQGEKIREGE